MRVIIAYPPLAGEKGYPTLGQNRQFQYFKEPTYIYPVVPASAATLLKQAGHEVIWLDCIAENITYGDFLEIIQKDKPDLIAFETKTPVIKQHWKIINDIKNRDSDYFCKKEYLPKIVAVPIFVLFGDHVTALPEESFENSGVDFVLTGGDYDFLLLNLSNFLSQSRIDGSTSLTINPERSRSVENQASSIQLEPGIYYRDGTGEINLSTALSVDSERSRTIKNTGKFQLNHDLNKIPFIDRDLTKWQLYASENGNYKRTPGTYIMSGRDCWWGKCTFCSWPAIYPVFRSRLPENVLDEIGSLIENYRVREIMDDTGCFPAGDWLKNFCGGMIKRGYNKKIYFDCNMRFGALAAEDFSLMKKANFRLLLFGLESANQATLDRVNKNLKAERIIADCKLAVKAGLFPHITIMFGYPWENYDDALRTLKLGKYLLKKGYAYTMQATVVIPYPGTPLFDECMQNNRLKTLDWDDYDMKQPVMQTSIADEKIMEMVQGMYGVSFQPEFILRKISSIKDIDDVKYYLRAAKKVFGHMLDFRCRACSPNRP